MRLELGRRADYAVRAIVDLCRHHDGTTLRKARQIAHEMNIPRSYLPQTLAELVRAELVDSVAGPAGGYMLKRDPAEISLGEAIEAVDGDLQSAECVLRGGPCSWEGVCAVHVPWSRAQRALLAQIDSTTFAEIAEIDAALEAGTYRVPAELEPARPPNE